MNISPHPKPQSLGEQNSGETVIRGMLPPASGEHCVILFHFLFGGSENKLCSVLPPQTMWANPRTYKTGDLESHFIFSICLFYRLLTQVMCPCWPTEMRFAARSWGVTGTSIKESTPLPYNHAQVSVFPHKSWYMNHVAKTRVVKYELLISWWVGCHKRGRAGS